MEACDVSVIIVNYNSTAWLLECLRSLYANRGRTRLEVIVVDNASRQGSLERVVEKFPQIVAIANDQNRGFAAATNQGLRIANGAFLLMLNPDTLIRRDVVQECCRYLEEHSDVGAVGCRVLDADGAVASSWMWEQPLSAVLLGVFHVEGILRMCGLADERQLKGDGHAEVDGLAGCFMLIRRRALKTVGLLDERYFMYWEDLDWCKRARRAGWRIMYAPVGEIVHFGRRSSQGKLYWVRHCRSRLRYVAKFYGKARSRMCRAMLVPWLVSRLAVDGARWAGSLGRNKDAREQLSDYVEALSWLLNGGR